MNAQSVITLTLGDMAENHVGMQQIGEMVGAGEGFTFEDLRVIQRTFEERLGVETELLNLSDCFANPEPPAGLLVLRNALDAILKTETGDALGVEHMLAEQMGLDVDKHAFMYGRVVNKHARWNLCFDETDAEPDYARGRGRIVAWDRVPATRTVVQSLETYFGPKARGLKGEGNYYYDPRKCGIGFHGDAERRKVIGMRLGAEMPMHFQWYYKGARVGERIEVALRGGDVYVMSEKTVGTDWKRKNVHTLRHATGCAKFTA